MLIPPARRPSQKPTGSSVAAGWTAFQVRILARPCLRCPHRPAGSVRPSSWPEWSDRRRCWRGRCCSGDLRPRLSRSARARRWQARAGAPATLYAMPELPEVETIARDLRGLVRAPESSAAAATGRRRSAATNRRHSPRPVAGPRDRGRGPARQAAAGVAGAGAVAPRSRRPGRHDDPSQDDRPALRRGGRHPCRPPRSPRVLSLADGRELRFRDIRKFGRIGLYRRDEATGEPVGGRGRGRPGARRRAARRRFHRARVSASCCARAAAGSRRCCSTRTSWPASATSTPTRLSGGPGSTRCATRTR